MKLFKKIIKAPVTLVQKGKDKAMNAVTLGIIRHVITALGGAAVAAGYIDDSGLQAIAGAIATLIGVGMSIYHKYQDKAAKQ